MKTILLMLSTTIVLLVLSHLAFSMPGAGAFVLGTTLYAVGCFHWAFWPIEPNLTKGNK